MKLFSIAQYGTFDEFVQEFELNILNQKNDNGSSLLHVAIAGENFDVAQFLVDQGIDVNLVNRDGQTPLHLIATKNNIKLAKILLESGADISIRDRYGNNPMWTAVFNCKGKFYDMVELFCKYKPDVTTKNNAGKSPLDFAIQVGNEKLIKLLQQ